MSTSVTLPALGESVTEGTISRWLKQVGDTIAADEPLVEVSTDKVDTEIPSPTAGVLMEIKAEEDDTVEVGAVLAIIGSADEAPGADESGNEAPAEEAAPEPEPAAKAPETEPEPAAESAPKAKPAARSAPSGKATGTEIVLPALGESVTEGTVSRWLKQVGDTVKVDEALVEISTDKVDTEVPSPVAGTVLELRAQEDDTLDVGAVLAVIGDADSETSTSTDDSGAPEESASEDRGETSDAQSVDDIESQAEAGDEGGQKPVPAPEPQAPEPEEKTKVQHPAANQPPAEPLPSSAPPRPPAPRAAAGGSAQPSAYVTPIVRKLAKDNGVDLATVQGTGVGGRIRKQDVLAAAEEARRAEEARKAASTKPAAAPSRLPSAEATARRGTTEKLSRMRLTIARRMVESLQVSAQLTATVEVDLTPISRLRAAVKDDFKARNGAGLSYLPFITKATVEALQQYPILNASIDTEAKTATFADAEHIGIAVDTPRGLMVPVIKDAGDLNVGGLARRIAELAGRTRDGSVSPDELAGGTFTITNYGSTGTLFDTPIMSQPQVGILGTGAIVKRPAVLTDPVNGYSVAIRDIMYLSLTYDHRLVDGADAGRFLTVIKQRLEEGDFGAEFGL